MPLNRSVGVGSEIQLLSEKNVYRSTALNLVRVEQLPASASAASSPQLLAQMPQVKA